LIDANRYPALAALVAGKPARSTGPSPARPPPAWLAAVKARHRARLTAWIEQLGDDEPDGGASGPVDVREMAWILRRSPETIRRCLRSNPHWLPECYRTRRAGPTYWDRDVVYRWLMSE
jgi:hypothetical protein